MLSLGIDIGGTSVKLALQHDATTLWTARSQPYTSPTTPRLIEAIRTAAAGRISHIDRVGLCVPGLLDSAARTVRRAVNVPGIVGVRLDDLVHDALGLDPAVPAALMTDAFASALDIFAMRRPAGRLLVLSIGTGVGAAVLDEGKPLLVDGDSPGHIGQIDVSLADEPVIAPDGGAGGLEGYIGAAALAGRYGDDPAAILPRLTIHDPPLRALARAIRISHAIYRPHHICLCGGIGIRLRHVCDDLHRAVAQDLTALARPGWTLTTGEDDFHAARGAAGRADGGIQ